MITCEQFRWIGGANPPSCSRSAFDFGHFLSLRSMCKVRKSIHVISGNPTKKNRMGSNQVI